MTVSLITGGTRGLGRETARRLIGLGHTVNVGGRDEGRGRAAADELGAHFLPLDVTDDASVAAAAADVTRREGRLDVLVNGAGAFEGMRGADEVTAAVMRQVFETNVFGAVRMTHAFLPLLAVSEAPVIVNVSSAFGSFGTVTDPGRPEARILLPVYASSRAALNMLTVQYAKALPGLRVNAAEPGLTGTDPYGSGSGTVEEGAEVIVRLATLGPDGPTGTFSGPDGPLPW
ncbi:SDR family NAD(P)-dependent oxidoreductase [Actinacidiphila glaucinigra]|uniref:SDR family NAD(P)-dependent oxidoreductase n=1 Tax=Actinacidiphila glaucinigra TaxID=235986 RepID=UPI0035DF1391